MIQQVVQEANKVDEQQFALIEELASAIEHINGQIYNLKKSMIQSN